MIKNRNIGDSASNEAKEIEQLKHANKMQSDFVSIVSHEIRTTLTSIQGFSELMRDEEFSLQEIKEFATDINADAKRLDRMVSELLDLERMKSGRMVLNVERVDLNAIIIHVAQHIRLTAPNHCILLQIDETLPLLSGNRDRLTQMVTNLVNNAIKYSPNGGEISVSSQVENDVAHVRVRDQGVGIPSDALERVFEAYCRIEAGTYLSPRQDSPYIKGTGLGLSIVRQIVQMHGGKVWVESMLGEGSVFHVTIPLIGVAVTVEKSNG